MQCSSISTTGYNAVECDKRITATAGTTLHIHNCESCTGDTIIGLYYADANFITSDDDGCGSYGGCSSITYTIPAGTPTQTFRVGMRCYGSSDPCSGSILMEATCNLR